MRPILRFKALATPQCQRRTFTSTPRTCITKDHTGRGPEEHVTNQTHRHNIQADASNRGQQARAEDQSSHKNAEKNSVATSQTSTSTAKEEEAKSGRKDRGMGLQDERGGVILIEMKDPTELLSRILNDHVQGSQLPTKEL